MPIPDNRELGVTLSTIHRWRRLADVHDASHTPHRLVL
jgi:hypothetical protein